MFIQNTVNRSWSDTNCYCIKTVVVLYKLKISLYAWVMTIKMYLTKYIRLCEAWLSLEQDNWNEFPYWCDCFQTHLLISLTFPKQLSTINWELNNILRVHSHVSNVRTLCEFIVRLTGVYRFTGFRGLGDNSRDPFWRYISC